MEQISVLCKQNYRQVAYNHATTAEMTTYQYNFPQQQQNLLHREVGSVSTTKLGDHCEQHHGKTIFTRHWKHWITTTEHHLHTYGWYGVKRLKRLKKCIALHETSPITELRGVTCHMGSLSVTCHPDTSECAPP